MRNTDTTHRHGVWFSEPTEPGRDPVPAGLDAIEPGPVLAALLSSIDVNRLSGYDRVTVLKAHQRMASHYSGAVLDDVAAVADEYEASDPGFGGELEPLRNAAAEIRTALNLTRRAADDTMALAMQLHGRLPEVRRWLKAGRIDYRRAKVIADGTAHLTKASAESVVAAIAAKAPNLTTGQLRARIRSLAIAVDPEDAAKRHTAATARRSVRMEPTVDGTAHLFAFDLEPDALAGALKNVDRIARSLRDADDDRTMDQLRADALVDLLSGRTKARSKVIPGGSGTIDIRVDLTTLVGLDENPADLGGYGPIIADIARKVASDHPEYEHRITVHDPDRDSRRTFTTRQRREIEASDVICVFPGCRMPAIECDIDHIEPWIDGGRTITSNGAPLCRHDHMNRHNGWTYARLDGGGYRWISPLGHISTTDPPDR